MRMPSRGVVEMDFLEKQMMRELEKARQEIERLRQENAQLRKKLGIGGDANAMGEILRSPYVLVGSPRTEGQLQSIWAEFFRARH
jgi:hypothetical protein